MGCYLNFVLYPPSHAGNGRPNTAIYRYRIDADRWLLNLPCILGCSLEEAEDSLWDNQFAGRNSRVFHWSVYLAIYHGRFAKQLGDVKQFGSSRMEVG